MYQHLPDTIPPLSGPKPEEYKFTSLLNGLVPERLQSPHLLLQIFLNSSVSFDLLLSAFPLPSIFSSSLHSKPRAAMQKLITLRLLCVVEHSLWGLAVCGSFQHHGQADLLSCDQGNWGAALHKVPGAPSEAQSVPWCQWCVSSCSTVPNMWPRGRKKECTPH